MPLFERLCYHQLMKKILILVGLGLILLGGLGYLIFGKVFSKPGFAALQVTSTPNAKVSLNGEEVGQTPYLNDKLAAGEYTLRLQPSESQVPPWEGKVNLVANIRTSVTRQLGKNDDSSSGEILTLEKSGNSKTASLMVVSEPDGALVKINQESKGFAPVSEDLTAAEYEITVSAPGFAEKTIRVQTVTGYKLNLVIKLAREEMGTGTEATGEGDQEASASGEDKETDEDEDKKDAAADDKEETSDVAKPYVKILSTPNGWLRVRLSPSTDATEAAKVDTGESFPYLGETENGWHKIEYEKDKEGWVSGVYSKLVK